MYTKIALLLAVRYIDYSLARYSAIYSCAKVVYFYPEVIIDPICTINRYLHNIKY